METLYSPWRTEFMTSHEQSTKPDDGSEEHCIFCRFPKENEDEKRYILEHGKYSYVIMNLYPYNPGHLLVIPYRHNHDYNTMTPEEFAEVMRFTQKGTAVLTELMHPHGFNIGMNVGKTAGAGIDSHLHMHVVPRWEGDTNFMPVFGGARVLSQSLPDTYKMIKKAWDAAGDGAGVKADGAPAEAVASK